MVGLNYAVQAYPITQFEVTMANMTVYSQGPMSIDFTLPSQHTFSSVLELTLPSQIVVDDLSLQTCPYTIMGFPSTALCQLTTNKLTIKSGFTGLAFTA
jgi:hypothetical protein